MDFTIYLRETWSVDKAPPNHHQTPKVRRMRSSGHRDHCDQPNHRNSIQHRSHRVARRRIRLEILSQDLNFCWHPDEQTDRVTDMKIWTV